MKRILQADVARVIRVMAMRLLKITATTSKLSAVCTLQSPLNRVLNLTTADADDIPILVTFC